MAKPPVNSLIRNQKYGTIGPAPDPVTQFAANVRGNVTQRAHEGLQEIRQAATAAPDLSDAFSVFGVSPRTLKEVGGAMGVLTSPVSGTGDTVGASMWNNPGDPRPHRLGDLTGALTPLPPIGKAVEGTNTLLRGSRVAAKAVEDASLLRTVAPISHPSSTASTVTPHQTAAAAWEKLGDLRQKGAPAQQLLDANNDAVLKSRALGVPVQGTTSDMVASHLQPAQASKPNFVQRLMTDQSGSFPARPGSFQYTRGNEPDPAWDHTGGGEGRPQLYDPNYDPLRNAAQDLLGDGRVAYPSGVPATPTLSAPPAPPQPVAVPPPQGQQ